MQPCTQYNLALNTTLHRAQACNRCNALQATHQTRARPQTHKKTQPEATTKTKHKHKKKPATKPHHQSDHQHTGERIPAPNTAPTRYA